MHHAGLRNIVHTEAVPGVLPADQNSPQRLKGDLYAEQFSESSFLAARHLNFKTWMYRLRPSVGHAAFAPYSQPHYLTAGDSSLQLDPNPLRWDPIAADSKPTDFVDGLKTVVASGDARAQTGVSIHTYSISASMGDRFFSSADGEFVFLPWEGTITVRTELGSLEVSPGHLALIPRGLKFQVNAKSGSVARGYLCENHGEGFRLPELGPIGANGLANPRHFLAPKAEFEDRDGKFQWIHKLGGHLYSATQDHSPFDVVAWHGNSAPYVYDLAKFNTIGTVSFDHPDPSIFTVLQSPSHTPGVSNCDFVIFPPRWMVAEHTFRPPYYHRNVMSEYMGLIHGKYDAKPEGFVPGGGSLHNAMTPHGPDAPTFQHASSVALKPEHYANTLAFMFESRWVFGVSPFARTTTSAQKSYLDCWKGLPKGRA